MKDSIKVHYWDIDGTLTTYASNISSAELNEKIEYMQKLFDEFKLNFPINDEIKEEWKKHNILMNFKLSQCFSKEMVRYILSINQLSLDKTMEELNRNRKDYLLEWHYMIKESENFSYYQIKCLNPNSKIYKSYDISYNSSKVIPAFFQTNVFNPESVKAINLLLEQDKPEVIVISSSWKYFMEYTIDMLKYQGIHLDGIKVEPLDGPTSYGEGKTRSDGIREDAKRRGIGNNYRVIDDDVTALDPNFGSQLIPVYNRLKLEDVYKVLGIEKRKRKVLKNEK